jgi:hypothetical protein
VEFPTGMGMDIESGSISLSREVNMLRQPVPTVCLLLVLMVAACGSSDNGVSCDKVCTKIVEDCQEDETMEECLDNCDGMKSILKSSAFSDTASCVLASNCEEDYSTTCLMEAAANISDKLVACTSGAMTKEKCLTDLSSAMGGDELDVLKIVQDSLLNCFYDCFDDSDCTDIMNDVESVIGTCFSTCGFDVFD